MTAGFPVNVVTLGMWLAPATKANGVTQLLVQLPVEAPATTAVEAVVQVNAGPGPGFVHLRRQCAVPAIPSYRAVDWSTLQACADPEHVWLEGFHDVTWCVTRFMSTRSMRPTVLALSNLTSAERAKRRLIFSATCTHPAEGVDECKGTSRRCPPSCRHGSCHGTEDAKPPSDCCLHRTEFEHPVMHATVQTGSTA